MHQQNFIYLPANGTGGEFEKCKVLSRVESDTSDLGDSKSDDGNSRHSSTFELESLVKAPETNI